MKKILCFILALTLCVGGLFGCKAPKAPNSTSDIELVFWKSGYGDSYIYELERRFESKYPEYNLHPSVSSEPRGSTVYMDPNSNTADLYITTFETRNAYTQYLEPLDEFLKVKPDGESGKTIGEKLGTFVDIAKASDGKIYSLKGLGASLTGLIYNVDLFKNEQGEPYKVPNTTDELIDLALTIKSDRKTPFIYYCDYWYYLHEAWVAQYDGLEIFHKNWNGIYVDENGVEHPNDYRIITESKGREEAYKVIAELCNPQDYAYMGTTNMTHTESQTYFLENKAVMMPNGAWVENEMRTEQNIRFMKTPVLSAYGKKLGIDSDEILSLMVDYVDGKTLATEDLEVVLSYGNSVIDAIRTARQIHYVGRHTDIFIPVYSNAKEAAKKFLEFYYSDEATKYLEEAQGTPMPNSAYSVRPTIDTSNWSDFKKQVFELTTQGNLVYTTMSQKLFYNGGLTFLWHYNPAKYMTYNEDGSWKNFNDYWTMEKNYYINNWQTILQTAGLTTVQ